MSPNEAPVAPRNNLASSRELVPAGKSDPILAERERIADELRVGSMHALFGIGLELAAIATTTPDDATAERLQGSVAALDRAAGGPHQRPLRGQRRRPPRASSAGTVA
jgi:signal transduction histidine kinase